MRPSPGTRAATLRISAYRPDAAHCASGEPLVGATYDIARSRFAFGSMSVPVDAGPLVRWTGSDGVVAIWSDGSEGASLSGGAPEANLPGWSGDGESIDAYVTAYFESMGVDPCQIAGADQTSGGSGGGPMGGALRGERRLRTMTRLSSNSLPAADESGFASIWTSSGIHWGIGSAQILSSNTDLPRQERGRRAPSFRRAPPVPRDATLLGLYQPPSRYSSPRSSSDSTRL